MDFRILSHELEMMQVIIPENLNQLTALYWSMFCNKEFKRQ
jgi:hypothetical protein